MSERFVPELPPLFDGFRDRRTLRQRRRAAIRAADIARQRMLVLAARMAKPITRRIRARG